ALQASLDKLQLKYLDLYLIHWPVAFKSEVIYPSSSEDYVSLDEVPISETWKQMEAAKKQGKALHIGVSNFSKNKLSQLVANAAAKPEMNQVEMHPLLQQNDLLSYCNSEGIRLTAYSPLGSGDRAPEMKAANEPNLFELPAINTIAKNRGVTPAQVLIGWHVNRGTAVIPKSTTKEHIISNFKAGDVHLNHEEMAMIADLDKNFRFINGKFFEAPEKGYYNIYDE
nr:aldo/keto reductase [Bacteroidota bacterium]